MKRSEILTEKQANFLACVGNRTPERCFAKNCWAKPRGGA